MDGRQFDAWTRALAAGQSRRGFLGRLVAAGAALGLAGAALPAGLRAAPSDPEEAAARCAEKAAALERKCAAAEGEKEVEKCAERVAELCAECPDLDFCPEPDPCQPEACLPSGAVLLDECPVWICCSQDLVTTDHIHYFCR